MSEMKRLLMESQREFLKLLTPKAGESIRDEYKGTIEEESRRLYTPTRWVKVNSVLNNESFTSRNMVTGVSTDSTN